MAETRVSSIELEQDVSSRDTGIKYETHEVSLGPSNETELVEFSRCQDEVSVTNASSSLPIHISINDSNKSERDVDEELTIKVPVKTLSVRVSKYDSAESTPVIVEGIRR